MNALHPRLRVQGLPAGQTVTLDAKYLRQFASVAPITDIGFIDIRKSVDGIGGYENVKRASTVLTMGSRVFRLLSVDGLIQSKRAMNRPQDRAALPELEAMREVRLRKAQDRGRH